MKHLSLGKLLPSFIFYAMLIIGFYSFPITSNYLTAQSTREWTKTSFIDSSTVYFLKNINDTIYAGSQRGLFRTIDKGETWDTIHHFSYVSSFTKHLGKYYSASYHYGVQTSIDMINWTDVSQGAPRNITSLLSTSGGLLMSTSKGVYKYDEASHSWGKDSLLVRSMHNDYIWQLVENNSQVFAIGSNYSYVLDIVSETWSVIKGDYEFEGFRSKIINDSLFISSSGGGMLFFSPTDDSINVYLGHEGLAEETLITDFDTLNRDVVYLSGNYIKFADKMNDDVCNTLLTSLLVIEDNILVGTNGNGIWKLSAGSILPRSIEGKSNITILPNPSSGSFFVHLSLQPSTEYSLNIINPLGNIIHKKMIVSGLQHEEYSIPWDIHTPGIYYVQLVSKKEKIVKEVIIQ